MFLFAVITIDRHSQRFDENREFDTAWLPIWNGIEPVPFVCQTSEPASVSSIRSLSCWHIINISAL